ncbi:MAG TPA: BREX system ATP-binding domain-containing protein [Kofleriaceae bacterium]|nr:BREX system ATP-binding domain-containing protein [Kofleriaceae bacterium]
MPPGGDGLSELIEGAPTVRGGGRFRLVEPLGAGAMGVVWDAVDIDEGVRVALKTMGDVEGRPLWAFKREFRLLRDLRHRGLVAMHELIRDDHGWFFTMEKVEGVPFVEHAAPGRLLSTAADSLGGGGGGGGADGDAPPPPVAIPTIDRARVSDAVVRLADALAYLHESGLVHRDLKPPNVLAEPGGRVVVLDFGLTVEALAIGRGGTLPYMAPEQHEGAPLTGAADMYAVGVMLHEILTGQVPFWGEVGERVLAAKRRGQLPRLDGAVDAIDGELAALCRELLAIEPARRPTAAAVVRRLGGAPARTPAIRGRSARLVGRERELAALDDELEAVRRGGLRAVAVLGEPGIGKSALVEHAAARAALGGALVLSARCSERERVPFRAVDGLVDDLVAWLATRDAAERATLLAGDAALLGEVFPVAAHVAPPAPVIVEPRARRERLFAGFRALLDAVVARQPVVIWLDDAQWADDDSIAMLAAALASPPPPLFLGVATRDEPPPWLPDAPTTIRLGPLARAAAAELARELAPAADVETLVDGAAGHPLYLSELAVAGAGASANLLELLRDQVASLPAGSRVLLERLAVHGGPLRRDALALAVPEGVELGAVLPVLRRMRLVASAPARGAVAFDVFHARVRDAVLSALDAPRRAAHHGALALAIERCDPTDAPVLATHWEGAGEPARAFGHAVAAAAAADSALAFERAVSWYRRALALGDAAGRDAARLAELRALLGGALASVGRGAEAAEELALAARGHGEGRAAELRRRAAEQLLLSGHIERGLALLHDELRAVGLRPAPTGRAALFALARARLAARRVDLAGELPSDRGDVLARRRTDALWSVAQGLVLVDTFAGAVAQSQHLPIAIGTGERYRASRALALEASYLAPMRGGGARADRALAAARRASAGDARATAIVTLSESVGAYFRGHYAEGLRLGEIAERALAEHCVGAVWEVGIARHHMLLDLVYMGEMAEAGRRLGGLLTDAHARGDRYADTYLRTGPAPFCALVADDPRGCRDVALGAVAAWAQPRWVVQIYAALMAVVQSHVYEGDGEAAERELAARWPALARSLLLKVSLVRVESFRLRARTALTRATATRGFARTRHAWAASRAIRVIEREPGIPAQPFALLSRAGLAHVRGDLDGARATLVRAAAAFDAADMRLMAACTRRCHGRLVGGTAGAAEVDAADAWMRAQTVVDPVRMTACLAPGFDA